MLAAGGWVLPVAGQSSRPGWGATPYAGGVTFRVWAPNATNVSVAGEFNGWSQASHRLVRESTTSGVWSADVAGTLSGQYKYVLQNPSNMPGWSGWRTDPRSRRVNAADNYNSIIYNPTSYNWQGQAFAPTGFSHLVVYEMHIGAFNDPAPGDGAPGTFLTATGRLDYIRDLGFTAVELMPINEFMSGTSWGYNPAFPFAIESSYGTPDDFKTFVKACHARGLAVLMDVVHNHWGQKDPGGWTQWQFDGWAAATNYGGVYFYNTNGFADTPWGPRPDYDRPEVVDYILDSFRMWKGEYHLDGFRWDAPKYILYTDETLATPIPGGFNLVQDVVQMLATEYPGSYNIAEDIKELSDFNGYWDLGFQWDLENVLKQSSDSSRDMWTVARCISGTPARVLFTDSHDTAGDLNGGQRLPAEISPAAPTDYWARKRSMLGAVVAFTAPGVPMILQGQEMLETNQFGDTRAVDWPRTGTFNRVVAFYRDLATLRSNGRNVTGGLQGDGCVIRHVNNTDKLIAWTRANPETPGEDTMVVANFSVNTRSNYSLPFTTAGTWYVYLNTDSTNYSADFGNVGAAEVAAAGQPATGAVTLGPYSAMILSRDINAAMPLRSYALTDTSGGNGNGQVDPGETLRLYLTLACESAAGATNIAAELATTNPAVTMVSAAAGYPDLAGGAVASNAAPYVFRVAPDTPCGATLEFNQSVSFNEAATVNRLAIPVGAALYSGLRTNVLASADVPQSIYDVQTIYSELPVAALTGVVADVNVYLRIIHTYDQDLTLALQHPDGTEVLLANKRGRSGDNYGIGDCATGRPTRFDDAALTNIAKGRAPFAGTYQPESPLSALNGKPIAGTWRLRITDGYDTDQGTNLCWGLELVHYDTRWDCACHTNRSPLAADMFLSTSADTPTNIVLQAGDPDGDAIAGLQIPTSSASGWLTPVNTTNWSVVYWPAHGFAGTDAFTYVASDGLTASPPATVTVVVSPPADQDGDGLPDAWEQLYFNSPTAGVAGADLDGDGSANGDEYRANTRPDAPASRLQVESVGLLSNGWPLVQWPAVAGTRYRIEWSGDLRAGFEPAARPPADEILAGAYGAALTAAWSDAMSAPLAAGTNPARYYRVRVLP